MNLVWAQGFRSVSLPLIEARQTGRPSGSSSQIFSFGVLIKHGCESPNLEMLMGKTAVNGWVIFHCHVTWMFVYRRVCCLVLYILIDICVQNMCQVSTSDIWEKTLSNPNATLLGYPFWETSIYIYCDLLWFIVIYAEIFGVYVYIYILYIYISICSHLWKTAAPFRLPPDRSLDRIHRWILTAQVLQLRQMMRGGWMKHMGHDLLVTLQ